MLRVLSIRAPKPNEVMVENGYPVTVRRYVKAERADDFRRAGWVVWVPSGTGWTKAERNAR